MDLGLKGKTAVVLSSSAGLGLAVAEALLAEGAAVALSGRTASRLEGQLARLRSEHGDRAWGEPLDVLDAARLRAHLESARARFGRLDILVANAGGPPPGSAAAVDEASLQRAYELTFLSSVRAIQIVLPWMRAQRHGRIVALTSTSVRQPIADLVTSNAMRAALTGYLKTLAGEVGRDGITVNSVCTGSFATERLQQLFATRAQKSGRTPAEERERAEGEIPLGRLGEPRELGDLVCFLCSERASFLHGVALPCDGGALRALY